MARKKRSLKAKTKGTNIRVPKGHELRPSDYRSKLTYFESQMVGALIRHTEIHPDFKDNAALWRLTIASEGYKRFQYLDTEGIPTIGIGTNVRDNPQYANTTVMEPLDALAAAKKHMDISMKEVERHLGSTKYKALDPLIRDVLVNLNYNVGFGKFKKFVGVKGTAASGDFEGMFREYIDSDLTGGKKDMVAHILRAAAGLPQLPVGTFRMDKTQAQQWLQENPRETNVPQNPYAEQLYDADHAAQYRTWQILT